MNALERDLHKAHEDWLLSHAASFTHAVTLTLKPYRMVLNDRGEFRDTLDALKAQTNFRYFSNRINANAYKNSTKRLGRRISTLAILEGDGRHVLLHYHCALGNFPEWLPEKAIESMIKHSWQQTPFGNEQVNVQPMTSARWISYSAKGAGRSSLIGLDLGNLHFPAASLT